MMNQKGVSITAVVFIIVILSFMGVIFVSLISTSSEESVVEYDSARALYIAEGGAEAIIGKLKQSPPERCGLISPDTCWNWNDGYLNRPLGADRVDVEVLQYENRDGSTAPCETFVSSIETGGAGTNPARTIYAVLSWSAAATLDINMFSDTLCATPLANVSKTTLSNAVFLRYTIPDAAPISLDYSVRVTNASSAAYQLRISHPDDTETVLTPAPAQFNLSSMRSIISIGKMNNARREIFTAFCRQGACPP
ncbi:MAG TPA: hypothetical protein VJ202_02175 [Thermodesulfobacteriota bacterium]|nr:hypothetical protein [Thermodesulfobacteriota bacterium]